MIDGATAGVGAEQPSAEQFFADLDAVHAAHLRHVSQQWRLGDVQQSLLNPAAAARLGYEPTTPFVDASNRALSEQEHASHLAEIARQKQADATERWVGQTAIVTARELDSNFKPIFNRYKDTGVSEAEGGITGFEFDFGPELSDLSFVLMNRRGMLRPAHYRVFPYARNIVGQYVQAINITFP